MRLRFRSGSRPYGWWASARSPRDPAAPMGVRTHGEPSALGLEPAPSGRRTFRQLLGGRIEECLEVRIELLFFQGRRLRAGPEEHSWRRGSKRPVWQQGSRERHR
jgi:hypothetical protein